MDASGQELAEHLALLKRCPPDEVAPLVFAEALSALLTRSAELVTAEARSWPAERTRRFSDLVETPCDEFSSGSLGRAATMLDLAGRSIVEEKVDPAHVRTVCSNAWGLLDAERLRTFAETPDKHELLRSVLLFLENVSPSFLLDGLSTEERRERRAARCGQGGENDGFSRVRTVRRARPRRAGAPARRAPRRAGRGGDRAHRRA